MAQLVAPEPLPETDVFLPFSGADAEAPGHAYDLWLRLKPESEWLFGCACHSPIAAFVCMRYVRATYPGITVKVKRQ